MQQPDVRSPSSRSTQAPRCACLTMQKNELTVLNPWVCYHGRLFGFENLFVFDNASTHPEVIETLTLIERKGVNVERCFKTKEDFSNKGDILGQRMAELRETNDFDWLIPLDCDEFFALEVGGTVIFEPTAIHAYLASLRGETRLPRVTKNYLNVLGYHDRFLRQDYEKVFFQARGFVEVDHGFHTGKSSLAADVVDTNIVYIHCHAKPFAIQVEHSREKLMHYCDVNDPDSLASHEKLRGVGWHLIKYLQMTEDEYLRIFQSDDAVIVPGFSEQLVVAGAEKDFLLGHMMSPSNPISPKKFLYPPGVWVSAGSLTYRPSNAVIVVGASGQYLCAVLQALDAVGVRTEGFNNLFIDKRWLAARMSGDDVALKRWLLVRSAQPGLWATWLPDISAIDDKVLATLRSPRIILVEEGDPAADKVNRLSRFYKERASRIEQLIDLGLPLLLIEQGGSDGHLFGVAEALLGFCSLSCSPENISSIRSNLATVGQPANFEGFVDHVKQDLISGWCWQPGSDQRLTVELYADGIKRAATCADKLRSDLATAGKGDGKFSFALAIGEFDLSEGSIIEMMVAGSSHRLGNSGLTLAELRKRGN